MAFAFRENTSSGKKQQPMKIGDQGARLVAKVLGYTSKPSKPTVPEGCMHFTPPNHPDPSKVK
jgi:hypothetical protein